ncbi:retrovirus-related pol polyprotein from transposon TNT 1-94 [Tanacetum coccineum]|uniref:Retrovirus-related pol polyprotein from transposon TNT 1-94 n=1 Tax=Tanacetum coccineum TaxID=301880 RepID=A0ABQ4YB64_9ASTR
MDQDSAHMVVASKVPMLKPGEYEIWRMRIGSRSYIQMIDYALWEGIKNDATLLKTKIMEGVMTEMPITTAEEKAQRRLEVKARSTLMMGIPNEHQLKFNSIKDAKKLLEAVEKRFGMSSSSSSTQNMAFVSSSNNNTSNTNEAANTAHGVSIASTQVNVANSTNIDNLSDAVIFNVESYNCTRGGILLGECRASRNMTTKNRKLKKAYERTNYALMAFTSSSRDSGIQVSNGLGPQKKLIFLSNVSAIHLDLQDQDYEEIDGGYVAFGGNPKGGKITGKESVNIACYVQNRVLVVKPHNKTPYELFHGRTPTLSFMRPFGCHVTILNTIDHLGKFDGKADEGFFVGYSLNSKAFRVFNSRTRIVEENLHIRFSESTPNVVGSGPNWLFNIDALTRTMNYEPIVVGWKEGDEDLRKESKCKDQEKEDNVNNTNNVNTVSSTVNVAGANKVNAVGGKTSIELPFDPNMHVLEDDSIFDFSKDDVCDGCMYQMDVKSAFHPDFPHRVYKVEKALYGLHQAPRAWYMKPCQTYLLDNGFQKGKIDSLILQKVYKGDTLLMSLWRITVLLGITVKKVKTASIPMKTQKPLLKNEDGEEVDVHMYRSMIGSLMYLTSSRLDIMFAVLQDQDCGCINSQEKLKYVAASDTHNMVAFLSKPTESDGFEQIMDVLNTHPIRYGLTINPTIHISCIEQFWSTVMAKNINGEEQLHALVDCKKIIITESSVRTNLQLVDEGSVDC